MSPLTRFISWRNARRDRKRGYTDEDLFSAGAKIVASYLRGDEALPTDGETRAVADHPLIIDAIVQMNNEYRSRQYRGSEALH
jgi:hypothetical protein